MRTITRTAFAVATAAALVGGSALSASAADDTTGATVQVIAGELTISAPAGSVAFPGAEPGALATVAFGATTVSDLTADAVGWTTSVSASDFVGTTDPTNVIPTANFQYTGATATTTGTVTVVDTTATTKTGTAVGNNTATWDATIGLSIPADALADNYTATITSSVL